MRLVRGSILVLNILLRHWMVYFKSTDQSREFHPTFVYCNSMENVRAELALLSVKKARELHLSYIFLKNRITQNLQYCLTIP